MSSTEPEASEAFLDEDALKEFTSNDDDWEASVLPDYSEPQPDHINLLSTSFGHKNFRPLQWKIISSIIYKRQDNVAIMPTGSGKSLCFQFPSVYSGGTTLVVSPLISLMEDQVLNLKVANIPACLLGSAQKKKNEVMGEILEGKYRLVYLTPEFCDSETGRDFLKCFYNKLKIDLIAVDEAHCVSFWGHDFRVKYRQLWMLRKLMPEVPILALTATATVRVQEDVVSVLLLRNPQISCSGFDRPNLYFEVNYKYKYSVYPDLKKFMVQEDGVFTFPGSTIIYTITRKMSEQIASVLCDKGVKCASYHAGMALKKRTEVHENFLNDKIRAVVATIAFGMGIDKPDIRMVIHYGSSENIENYYQAIGRAGRDGKPSDCIMFYEDRDFLIYEQLNSNNTKNIKNLEHKAELMEIMKRYLSSRTCRRMYILDHFEGPKNNRMKTVSAENCCDVCRKRLGLSKKQYQPKLSTGFAKSNQEQALSSSQSTLYQLLVDKRAQLAKDNGCNPSSIASNLSLIKMCQMRPLTLIHLKNCHLGMGKAKIEKFGQTFLDIIEDTSATVESDTKIKRTIQHILMEHPLPGAKYSKKIVKGVFSLYASGVSLKAIANRKKMTEDNVTKNLIHCLNLGHPVKLEFFGVTAETAKLVYSSYRNISKDTTINTAAVLRTLCPKELTEDQFTVISKFIEIREHLEKLKIPYEEFEEAFQETKHKKRTQPNASITNPDVKIEFVDSIVEIGPSKKKKRN